MTVVGIVGPSYCGSTIFERIIGRHQGVQTVGESHWLLGTNVPWRGRCSFCAEEECGVFSSQLLASARDHEYHWFDWLQTAVGDPKIMLSSDKNVVVYDRIGAPNKAIVLFRDPIAWCTSWVVNAGRQEERYAFNELPRLPDDKLMKAAFQFRIQYTRIFDWLKQHSVPYVVVNMNALVDEPRTWVSWLCKLMGLTFLTESLNISDQFPLHTIGGNPDVVFKRAPKALRNNMKWRRILTVEQHCNLERSKEIRTVHKRLVRQAQPKGTWRTCV